MTTPSSTPSSTARPGGSTRPRRAPLDIVAGVLRIVVGLFFLAPGIAKFADRSAEIENFTRWGVPAPEVVVPLVGAVEIVCGLLLAAGSFMPLPALILGIEMVGALLTAGVEEGGARIVIPLVVLAALALVLARWGGPWQLGPRIVPSRS